MSERKLFVQHIRTIPTIDVRYWSFALSGMVRTPLILSYNELLSYPETNSFRMPIACSSDAQLVGWADWRGVLISDLIRHHRIEIDPRANYATAYSADGYSTTLPIRFVYADMLLLAYQMNDAPLSPEHGYPIRLISVNCAGYKMPKWITRIDLTEQPVPGFWEQRGASIEGDIRPTAKILSATSQPNRTVKIRGEVYMGFQVCSSVDLRVDGGEWMSFPYPPYSTDILNFWFDWQPPYAGDFNVEIRPNFIPVNPRYAVPETIIASIIRVPPELFA